MSLITIAKSLFNQGKIDQAFQVWKVATVKESGINDPFIFKALMLAGGPGSGKTYISDEATKGLGLKVVNSDAQFEPLLKKRGLSLKIDANKPEDNKNTRDLAKKLTNLKAIPWLNGMLGLVIDGTGRDASKIKKVKKALEDIGYDVGMVYVDTTLEVALERNLSRPRTVPEEEVIPRWKAVQKNKSTYKSLFGKNFYLVPNNESFPSDKKEQVELGKKFRNMGLKFLNRPLANPIGQNKVEELKKIKGKVLSDLGEKIEKNLSLI